jgi:hypothetical protein
LLTPRCFSQKDEEVSLKCFKVLEKKKKKKYSAKVLQTEKKLLIFALPKRKKLQSEALKVKTTISQRQVVTVKLEKSDLFKSLKSSLNN